MISYLGIEFSHQSIGNHNRAKLLDLIRLAPRSPSPQVQDFRDAVARENVMATIDALSEAYFREQWAHPNKGNVAVGRSAENRIEELVGAGHGRGESSENRVEKQKGRERCEALRPFVR
jgi:hypothetical protein